MRLRNGTSIIRARFLALYSSVFFFLHVRCGDRLKCIALSESSREKVLCGIADFMHVRCQFPVLVIRFVEFSKVTIQLNERHTQFNTCVFAFWSQLRNDAHARRALHRIGDPVLRSAHRRRGSSSQDWCTHFVGIIFFIAFTHIFVYFSLRCAAETLTYGVLCSLPCRRRVLLSGTPMQNNLDEFFAMADLVNPGIFGDERLFRKQFRR